WLDVGTHPTLIIAPERVCGAVPKPCGRPEGSGRLTPEKNRHGWRPALDQIIFPKPLRSAFPTQCAAGERRVCLRLAVMLAELEGFFDPLCRWEAWATTAGFRAALEPCREANAPA